jgi:integration host factor subunit alpha
MRRALTERVLNEDTGHRLPRDDGTATCAASAPLHRHWPYGKSAIMRLPPGIGESLVNDETLTRADLATVLNRQIGLSNTDSAKLVAQILDQMRDALAKGENVKISGFGTFLLRDKAGRIGRNPKTGVEAPISPRRVLTFRPSGKLRERIVAGD